MKNARLLAILLVAATVLVDLVALSAAADSHGFPPEWPHPARVVLVALAMSQVSLAAIWMGWGRAWLSWRTLILVLTVVVWSRLMAWSVQPDSADTLWNALVAVWFSSRGILSEPDGIIRPATMYGQVLSAQCLGFLVPSCLVRIAGAKLIRESDVQQPDETIRNRRRSQFSLGYLLSWMTVLAVSLGALQHAFDYRFLWDFGGWSWWSWWVFPLAYAALALAALWTALGTRRPWLRCVALALTTVGGIAAVDRLAVTRAYTAFCVLQVAWLLASLWVVRVAGYRIVRAPRARPDRRSTSPDPRQEPVTKRTPHAPREGPES